MKVGQTSTEYRSAPLPPFRLPSTLGPANVAARQHAARPRQGTRPLLFVSPQQQGSCPGRANTRHHIVNNNNGPPLPPHCCEVGCRVLVLLGQSPIKVICYFLYVVFGSASVRRGEPNNLLLIQKIPGIFLALRWFVFLCLGVVVFAVTA